MACVVHTRRRAVSCSLLLCALAACGAETSSAPAVDASADVTGAVDDGGSTAQDAAAGDAGGAYSCEELSAAVKGQPPTRSALCEAAPEPASLGCQIPWYGATAAGANYTCNRCPNGDPIVQGTWRAVDGKTEDPSVVLSKGFRETLTFDGNTWRLRARVLDDAGKEQKIVVYGWYWCSDAAEFKSAKVFHHVLKVDGSDFFGWSTSYVFTAYFLTNGPNKLAWSMDTGVEQSHVGELLYCRVGSTVEGQACTDPFEEASE